MVMDITKLSKKQIRALQSAGVLEEMIGGQKDATTPPYIRPVYDATWNQPSDGGIFTQPGVRPEMYSALRQPVGITQLINPVPSNYAQERIGILTGQLASSGTNPTDICGAPVTPGDLKTCAQWYNWGVIHIGSQKINAESAGELANRAVEPRVILNRAVNDPFIPTLLQDPNINFMSLEAQAMYQLGTQLRRSLAPVMFTGNPATAAASATAGWIKELTGLDRLIVTGHTDMDTGNTCPAADSTIINWGGAAIDSSVGGQNITQQITAMVYGQWVSARQLGMEDASWALIMHPDQFYALTAVYACQYATYRCLSSNAGQPIVQQAPDINDLRLSMINGSYLLIEGRAVPVIQDDAIALTAAGGNYRQADIYFMPLMWQGRPQLHFEFFPMDNQFQNELAGHFPGQTYVTNNGMYRMWWDKSMSCMQMVLDAKVRMWLETPFLCARLQNVAYISNTFYHSPFPGVTGYVDGGTVSELVNPKQP